MATLERNMPIQFGCIAQYDATTRALTVTTLGVVSQAYSVRLDLQRGAEILIDENGLDACVTGHLVHESDTQQVALPLLQRLANYGLGSVVIAPLIAEQNFFGVLIAARHDINGFSSPDCEFLKQLS